MTLSFSGAVETDAASRPAGPELTDSPIAGTDGVIVVDAAQRCVTADAVIAHLFDTDSAAFNGRALAELPLPAPLLAVLANTADAALAANSVRRARVTIDGNETPSRAFSILAMPGTTEHVTLIVTPSSSAPADAAESTVDYRTAHLRAEAALFMRDHVLGVVSHDLRGPLNAIHSWGYVLERKVDAADAPAQRALGGIRSGVEQQVKLIEQFIDTTRAETKTLSLHREQIALRTLVDTALTQARASIATQRQVTLTFESALVEEQIHGDRERLTQALWLMLAFASEASAAGSQAILKAHLDGSTFDATVSFTASEKALSDPALVHVLEAFARAQSVLPRETGRIAWGLALCKRVSEAHNGTFEHTDIADGAPGSLTLRIPVNAG